MSSCRPGCQLGRVRDNVGQGHRRPHHVRRWANATCVAPPGNCPAKRGLSVTAARLPAANQARRFADRQRLSCRDQYASGAASPRGGAISKDMISKDMVSRVWREVKGDWDAGNARSFAEQSIIRLILDGTVVRVRLDQATAIVLLVVLGVREAVSRQEYGLRDQRGVARRSPQSDRSRAAQARVSDRRRRHWVRNRRWLAVGVTCRCNLHGPQAPTQLAHAPSVCMRKSRPTTTT